MPKIHMPGLVKNNRRIQLIKNKKGLKQMKDHKRQRAKVKKKRKLFPGSSSKSSLPCPNRVRWLHCRRSAACLLDPIKNHKSQIFFEKKNAMSRKKGLSHRGEKEHHRKTSKQKQHYDDGPLQSCILHDCPISCISLS